MFNCMICGNTKFSTVNNLFDDRFGASGKHKIMICKACGFGKTLPGLADKEIPEFYSKNYPLRKVSAAEVINSIDKHNQLQRWLMGINNVAHQYVKANSTALDIGSASGVSLLELKNIGVDAYGIEPDPNGQKIAKKLGLTVCGGLITDNPYSKKKFDYITASQVIEHTNNPKLFIQSARKKLNRGGKLIMSFPNSDSLYRKIFGRYWINWHIPYHLNHFTIKSIELLAQKNGFKVDALKTITPNLWTSLQFVSCMYKSKYGSPNNIWTNNYEMGYKPNIKRIFVNLCMKFIWIVSLPVNRIIDVFGQGDSILIILSMK